MQFSARARPAVVLFQPLERKVGAWSFPKVVLTRPPEGLGSRAAFLCRQRRMKYERWTPRETRARSKSWTGHTTDLAISTRATVTIPQRSHGVPLEGTGRRFRRICWAKYAVSEDDGMDADIATSQVATGYTAAPKGFCASDRRVSASKPL